MKQRIAFLLLAAATFGFFAACQTDPSLSLWLLDGAVACVVLGMAVSCLIDEKRG